MSKSLPITMLPGWAFRTIAKSDIDVLIDRCEFETIVMTRQGRPDLVLISNDEWTKLTAAATRASRHSEVSKVEKAESTDGRKE
jgi:PHD/YefM family antitoxin component YafN of YafNO toxin-antitoxin module